MGQYFKLINYDKKQRYNPADVSFAMKWYGFTRGFANSIATIDLLSHDWQGDHIAIIGDYENEKEYSGDHMKDIPENEIRSLIERNINVKFEKSPYGWYELPDRDDIVYSGYKSDKEYLLINYDKKEYIDFNDFPGQKGTYHELINTSHSTGAYFTICYLLSSSFSYANRYDSWSSDRVGIIVENVSITSSMKNITKDVLKEPEISAFYEDEEW